ncbi:MAG: tetratricopeptide repeat protein [Coleofasciculus sp. C1-SOL-03]|uniref:hypothetical protein n=1 Tax=Coleofasciculus sp. C1-SOL-03 TaxID=3069522 RepID=UPI0032FA42F4
MRGYRIESLDLELSPSPESQEKQRILDQICQEDGEAKARLEKMAAAERKQLMAAPSMLVLMLQLSEGKPFDLIVADVIRRLPSDEEYPVYQVFGVICSFYQYGMTTPAGVLPLCLPDYSKKAVRDVVDFARDAELKGLVNIIWKRGYDGLATIHELIAQTAMTVKYRHSRGENLPYSPNLLADHLRAAISALNATKETHKRWVHNGLRLLAVNGEMTLVRQVLDDYPNQIQSIQQGSAVTGWFIWSKMYEAVGLLAERDHCLDAILSTEPQSPREWTYWLSLIERRGTNQQKQEAIALTTNWLQLHPDDSHVREKYIALIGQCGTSQQKQEAIALTTTWLELHPDDYEVRRTYLAVVRKAGQNIIDIEPIIIQQWQWISQQSKVDQSVWEAFLPFLYHHAQPQIIKEAVNLALQQYPDNTRIICLVFGYFRDNLDHETCYRLADFISQSQLPTDKWHNFIPAANFFRDCGELDKATEIYQRIIKNAKFRIRKYGDDLQKEINFASLNYALLLLLRQPPDPYTAMDYLQPILAKNQKHGLAHLHMAWCYQAQGHNHSSKGRKVYQQAIKHFQKAIKFDNQKNGHFWYEFGCFYRDAMQNPTEARTCFENSLNQNINLPACVDLAELEVADGNFDRARELVQQGLALVPMTRPEREQRDRLESRIQAIQAQFDA